MTSRGAAGFTLMELVIAMTIIGIIAAIGIPSYQSFIRESRRADAIAALLDMQLRQENWRANNNTYTNVGTNIGQPTAGTAFTYYTFSIPVATATAYTIQAVAKSTGKQNTDKDKGASCATLSINQSGTKSPAACW